MRSGCRWRSCRSARSSSTVTRTADLLQRSWKSRWVIGRRSSSGSSMGTGRWARTGQPRGLRSIERAEQSAATSEPSRAGAGPRFRGRRRRIEPGGVRRAADAAGMVDDPRIPTSCATFDGILWTKNVTPKRTREGASPAGVPAPAESVRGPPRRLRPTGMPRRALRRSPSARGLSRPPDGAGARWRPYGLQGLQPAIIDSGSSSVFSASLVGGWFLVKAMTPVFDAPGWTSRPPRPTTSNAAIALLDVALRRLLLHGRAHPLDGLQLFFLTRWSARPAKRILGIQCRRDRPGRHPRRRFRPRGGSPSPSLLRPAGTRPSSVSSPWHRGDLLWPLVTRVDRPRTTRWPTSGCRRSP